MSDHPHYGRAFEVWRDQSSDPWRAYTRHVFVEGLRDGSLPRSAFLHYLVQDYIFLVHFSRAWGLGIAKADSLAEMKACAATVDALVNHEMQLHVETCARNGLSEDQLIAAAEEPENLAYTRFVLEKGYSGDFLDLITALAPCVFGYGEIGARLGVEKSSDTYGEWIGTYAGSDYQSVCKDVGNLIDTALVSRLGDTYQDTPRWQTLCKTFDVATQLEVSFWDMGLRGA